MESSQLGRGFSWGLCLHFRISFGNKNTKLSYFYTEEKQPTTKGLCHCALRFSNIHVTQETDWKSREVQAFQNTYDDPLHRPTQDVTTCNHGSAPIAGYEFKPGTVSVIYNATYWSWKQSNAPGRRTARTRKSEPIVASMLTKILPLSGKILYSSFHPSCTTKNCIALNFVTSTGICKYMQYLWAQIVSVLMSNETCSIQRSKQFGSAGCCSCRKRRWDDSWRDSLWQMKKYEANI